MQTEKGSNIRADENEIKIILTNMEFHFLKYFILYFLTLSYISDGSNMTDNDLGWLTNKTAK